MDTQHCEMCGRTSGVKPAKNPENKEQLLCRLCAKGSAELLDERVQLARAAISEGLSLTVFLQRQAGLNANEHQIASWFAAYRLAEGGPLFVAIKKQVMRGAEFIAIACSTTMARRIARALNEHKINSRGI